MCGMAVEETGMFVSDFMLRTFRVCLMRCGDCQIFCLRGVFTDRLLPPGLLPVLVSLLLICVLVASLVVIFTFPGYLPVELFSPAHLLIRGVVESCSAKSIVGSSRLWPCLAFFAY